MLGDRRPHVRSSRREDLPRNHVQTSTVRQHHGAAMRDHLRCALAISVSGLARPGHKASRRRACARTRGGRPFFLCGDGGLHERLWRLRARGTDVMAPRPLLDERLIAAVELRCEKQIRHGVGCHEYSGIASSRYATTTKIPPLWMVIPGHRNREPRICGEVGPVNLSIRNGNYRACALRVGVGARETWLLASSVLARPLAARAVIVATMARRRSCTSISLPVRDLPPTGPAPEPATCLEGHLRQHPSAAPRPDGPSGVVGTDFRSLPRWHRPVSTILGPPKTDFVSTIGMTKICVRTLEYKAQPGRHCPNRVNSWIGPRLAAYSVYHCANRACSPSPSASTCSPPSPLKPTKFAFYDASVA